jgi:hypothetical protein
MAKRSDRQGGDPYTVGYRKPPIATQFKNVCSGNPSGRPRRSRNVRTILKEILNRKITVRDCYGERKIATQEAMLLKFLENALKGDPRALKTIVSLWERYGDDPASTIDPTALAPDDQQLIKDFFAQQTADEARRRLEESDESGSS